MLTFDPQKEIHVGQHADAANVLLKDINRADFQVPAADQV
jgi:hypothetical protein